VLGGGGYTIRNVSRCWTYETAVVLGEELDNELPYNDYYEYYGPNYDLHVPPNPNMENANSRQYLETVKQQVYENLRMLNGAPGVQMQQVPPDLERTEAGGADGDPSADERGGSSSGPAHPAEYYEGNGSR